MSTAKTCRDRITGSLTICAKRLVDSVSGSIPMPGLRIWMRLAGVVMRASSARSGFGLTKPAHGTACSPFSTNWLVRRRPRNVHLHDGRRIDAIGALVEMLQLDRLGVEIDRALDQNAGR